MFVFFIQHRRWQKNTNQEVWNPIIPLLPPTPSLSICLCKPSCLGMRRKATNELPASAPRKQDPCSKLLGRTPPPLGMLRNEHNNNTYTAPAKQIDVINQWEWQLLWGAWCRASRFGVHMVCSCGWLAIRRSLDGESLFHLLSNKVFHFYFIFYLLWLINPLTPANILLFGFNWRLLHTTPQ